MARKSKICTLCMTETPELAKNYCDRCPEVERLNKRSEKTKKYYENNRYKMKKYRENNHDKELLRMEKWRKNNIDKIKEYQKEWRDKNPNYRRDYNRAYYLRKKAEKAEATK